MSLVTLFDSIDLNISFLEPDLELIFLHLIKSGTLFVVISSQQSPIPPSAFNEQVFLPISDSEYCDAQYTMGLHTLHADLSFSSGSK